MMGMCRKEDLGKEKIGTSDLVYGGGWEIVKARTLVDGHCQIQLSMRAKPNKHQPSSLPVGRGDPS
jgi:hypothetical protein